MLTMKIKDFNDHLDFLTKRANELGWIGKFNKFRIYNLAPLFSITIYQNKTKDFKFFVGSSFLYDIAKGKFYYNKEGKEFKIDEKWIYYIFFLTPHWIKDFKYISFLMGYNILFTNLKIYIKSNFELEENYPKNFKGENLRIYIGITKEFKRLQIGLLGSKTVGGGIRRIYKSKEGYLYEGNYGNPGDRKAILTPSSFCLRITYKL